MLMKIQNALAVAPNIGLPGVSTIYDFRPRTCKGLKTKTFLRKVNRKSPLQFKQ